MSNNTPNPLERTLEHQQDIISIQAGSESKEKRSSLTGHPEALLKLTDTEQTVERGNNEYSEVKSVHPASNDLNGNGNVNTGEYNELTTYGSDTGCICCYDDSLGRQDIEELSTEQTEGTGNNDGIDGNNEHIKRHRNSRDGDCLHEEHRLASSHTAQDTPNTPCEHLDHDQIQHETCHIRQGNGANHGGNTQKHVISGNLGVSMITGEVERWTATGVLQGQDRMEKRWQADFDKIIDKYRKSNAKAVTELIERNNANRERATA
jgi:hypothetical protein